MRAIHGLAVAMGIALLLYADLGAPDWMLWVFLGLFAAGDIGLVAMGLGALAAAGVLHLAPAALHRRDSKC